MVQELDPYFSKITEKFSSSIRSEVSKSIIMGETEIPEIMKSIVQKKK